jgi:hypothetical protein
MVPRVYGRSYAIEAELHVPQAGVEGVIVANADFIGGFGLWVDGDGMLNQPYSFLGVEICQQTSTEKVQAGDVMVKMLFTADEPKPGAPYAFTGTVKKVTFDLGPATHEDEKALHEYAQVHAVGEGAAG